MSNLKVDFAAGKYNWSKTIVENDKPHLQSVSVVKGRVPDLQGMGAKDAMYLLGQLGLHVQLQGKGKVVKQNIAAGAIVKKGQLIRIELN
jgi:cell division protein FtsI (penicillin-binding protein 3)